MTVLLELGPARVASRKNLDETDSLPHERNLNEAFSILRPVLNGRPQCCTIFVTGEAEAGSAGEQPAKE
jgi:hypothetical protein